MTIEKIMRRICDRCGHTDEATASLEVGPKLTSTPNGFGVDARGNRFDTVDLCKRCHDGFVDWFNSGAKGGATIAGDRQALRAAGGASHR